MRAVHRFAPLPEMPLLFRCVVCGYGWKVTEDNDRPCPGAHQHEWANVTTAADPLVPFPYRELCVRCGALSRPW